MSSWQNLAITSHPAKLLQQHWLCLLALLTATEMSSLRSHPPPPPPGRDAASMLVGAAVGGVAAAALMWLGRRIAAAPAPQVPAPTPAPATATPAPEERGAATSKPPPRVRRGLSVARLSGDAEAKGSEGTASQPPGAGSLVTPRQGRFGLISDLQLQASLPFELKPTSFTHENSSPGLASAFSSQQLRALVSSHMQATVVSGLEADNVTFQDIADIIMYMGYTGESSVCVGSALRVAVLCLPVLF